MVQDARKTAKQAREVAELAYTLFALGMAQTSDCPNFTDGEARAIYIVSLMHAWNIDADGLAKAAKLHSDIRSKGARENAS